MTFFSNVTEIAFHSLLVEWKEGGMDRVMYQDPDNDRYTSDDGAIIFDHAADELDLIAVSKSPTRLLPHAAVVRTNLEHLEQKTTPLMKICCVMVMENANPP